MSPQTKIEKYFRLTIVICIISLLLFTQFTLAQTPSISPPVSDHGDFPDTQICVDIPLVNTGSPGYGPYLQVIIPSGLTFDSASLFGLAITPINEGVFPPAPGNQLDDSIISQPVTGPEDDTLILLQPPIGSVVTGGPALSVNICYTIDVTAPVNIPLMISATPVYEFGDTPTGDNGPIIGATDAFDTTPILVRFRKEDTAPEGERPAGPSWPVTYTLTTDIASGNTIDNIVIADTLPGNFVLTASSVVPAATPNCSITVGATLTVNCTTITGTNVDDVVVTYTGYYDDVLDETTCGTDNAINTATFDGDFAANPITQLTDNRTIQIEHVSIQKGAAPFENLSPGDTVTFTLNLQTSDYAEASSIQLQDILPDGLSFDAGSETASFGAIIATVTNNVPTNGATTLDFDLTAAYGSNFPAGTSITITYTASVNASYFNGSSLLASDSLSNTVASTYGLVGGAAACVDTSATIVEIEPVTVQKEVISTGPYYPGDTVTYRLSLNVPSGDTNNVIFTDFFPLPVLFATSINTGTDLALNPDINLSPTDTLGLTPTSITTDAATNSLVINWPNITTATPQVLSVEVSVDLTTEPFDDDLSLSNLLQVSTENTGTISAKAVAPVLINVKSPKVTMTKGIAATNGNGVINPAAANLPTDGNLTAADAGDTVTYVVTIENVRDRAVYDVTITDPSVAGLTACAADSVLDGQGNVLATTGNLTTGLVLTNPLPANVGATGAPYDIDTALLSYTCTIDTTAQTNSTLINEATVTFAAVAGGTIIRRPKDTATVQITAPSLSKTILSTAPNADADNSTVTIGETIQYQIVMSIPEGTVPSSVLVDDLDAGLVFQSFDSITPSNTVDISTSHGTFTGVLADATGLGTSTATFPFDNIFNTNTDNAVAETITIIYTVLVQDVAGNTSGGLRNNAAVLSYTGGTAAVNAPNVTLQEPNLTINKTVNPTSADAGDTITYTMVIVNTGTSMAYDAIASDALTSPFLNLNTGSVTTTQGVITTGNTLGDTTILITIGDMVVGASVTITFDVTLDATTPSGASIVNTGSIDGYNSLSGGGRAYGPTTDTATVTGVAAVVTKTTLNATSTEQSGGVAGEGNAALVDLTIGEEVTFEITATLAEGVSPSVIITDTLPNNATGHMEVTGFTIQPFPGATNLTLTNPNPANTGATANVLELDFGSVTNVADGVVDANDQIVIQITAVVLDDAVNSGLEVLTNNVMVQYNTGLTASASSDVEIVEPRMTVNKTGSTTSADAGDIITFTITIDNLGANNSQANAFDVDLSDVIPADYTYAGNLQLISGPAVDAGTLINNAGTIQTHWTQFDLGQSAVITYDVMVNNTVAPEQVVTNTAQVAWSSMPGANANERSGSVSESHSVTMTAPGLIKSVTNTSEVSSTTAINGVEEDILIGETVTYQFTITIPEGTSAAATAVDQLPTVSTIMNVVSSQIVSIGGQLSFTPATVVVGQAGIALDSDVDTYADRVTWNLGDIFNMPDGLNNANDQITFEVVAMLVDEPVNQNGGNDIVNTATFTTGLISSTDTALIDIIEPVINVTKATVPNAITADAGDVLDYQITITHDAASNADAFNFTVTDELPAPGTTWLGFTSSTCGAVTTDASAPPNIVFTFDALALADASCVINYQVTVEVGVNPNETYQNTVTASYQSTDVPNAETRTDSIMDSTSFITPDPAIIKVSSTSSNSDTGNTVQDGLLADLAIGEEIDFTLTVIFPEGTTTNAIVVDSLPVFASGGMLEAVSATVDSIGANLTSSLPGTAVLSDVDSDANNINDTITFDFGTVVNTPDGAVTTADHIVITVTARVVDDAVNVNLDTLTNTATFTYGAANMLSDTSDVEIVEPVLGLSKSMGPMVDHVVPVTLTFTNTGTAPAYDIVIQDVIDTTIWDVASIAAVVTPAGYTFASTAGPGANQQTISYTVTNSMTDFIAPGATQVFTFNLTLLAGVIPPTTLNNTATVTEANSMPGVDANERDFSDIIANASLPIPVLDAIKAVSLIADTNMSGGASPTEVLEYAIVVTNTGTGDAHNVTVVDAPDANVTLNVGSVATTIGVVSIGNTAGDAIVDVAVGTIPAGGSVTIGYRVTINSPLATGINEIVNQALIESDETPDIDTDDPTTGPNDDPTIIPVDAAPDLVVTKTDGGISTVEGGVVIYTISYSNIGTQDATGVVITETVPVNSIFNTTSSTGIWSCADASPAGTVCTQTIGNVNAGGPIATVDFAVTVDDPINAGETELLNNVSISDDGNNGVDLDVTNNDDTDNTPFLVVPDLQIAKDDNITSILPGGSITYTLTYSNVGGQTATGVVITETVPANTTFDAGASDAAWACAANTPGSACTLTLGTVLGSGGTGSVLFVVTVDDPISIGVDGITNAATIVDDGTNGVDPTPGDNSSNHDTPVDAAPDLFVTKSDGDITSGPGQTIVYTLSYGNIGNQGATNVVLNEVVPANSTYNAGASSVAWVCAGGSIAAGTACQFNLGILNIGDTGSATFAVDVDDPLAIGINLIVNTVVIADDGANGMDTNPTNNTGTDDTSLQLEPPVGLKVGEFDAIDDRLIHWTVWWFNPNNDRDLPVFIFDDIPLHTLYIPGSAACVADGTSTCAVPTYNTMLNRIELTAILGEDQGAPITSMPATLNNEVVITFDTRVVGTGGIAIENQAFANWDENNDGDPNDDANNGQGPIPTDDPLTVNPGDPTILSMVFKIPALSLWSLITMIIGIFIVFGFKSRANKLY